MTLQRIPSPSSLTVHPAWCVALALAWITLAPASAEAFCGFYVGGAGQKLFNNATQVVLMRDGKRTVLSMQNNYQGPPNDFAMVIPVPVVLQKDNVKTLPPEVLNKVDQMGAPRLVEYWERDPCYEPPNRKGVVYDMAMAPSPSAAEKEAVVKVEAQFEVGEYEVVILSATESNGLDTWLRDNQYNIPDGAAPVLKPYVEGGMYFFVAKVNVKKVKFGPNQQAMLSPLRFYYDSDTFSLPVRLGLLNANGAQDLIVSILARGQRYEMANLPNATIPTNLEVADEVRDRFGEFYAALFDKTLEKNPGAVVTEYSWDASTCDPCPGPNLNGQDFLTLGADVLKDKPQYGFVLTRLHARYTKDQLKEDLVFKAAPPIVGGREHRSGDQLERGAQPGKVNNFQGRYIIRHPWDGPIACLSPKRGVWGGPPSSKQRRGPTAAQNTAFAPRGALKLGPLVRGEVAEVGVQGELPPLDLKGGSCGACTSVALDARGRPWGEPAGALGVLAVLGLLGLHRRGRQARG